MPSTSSLHYNIINFGLSKIDGYLLCYINSKAWKNIVKLLPPLLYVLQSRKTIDLFSVVQAFKRNLVDWGHFFSKILFRSRRFICRCDVDCFKCNVSYCQLPRLLSAAVSCVSCCELRQLLSAADLTAVHALSPQLPL